jgi:hypothetical protein
MGLLSKSVLRLHAICAFFALGSFVWGYVPPPTTPPQKAILTALQL